MVVISHLWLLYVLAILSSILIIPVLFIDSTKAMHEYYRYNSSSTKFFTVSNSVCSVLYIIAVISIIVANVFRPFGDVHIFIHIWFATCSVIFSRYAVIRKILREKFCYNKIFLESNSTLILEYSRHLRKLSRQAYCITQYDEFNYSYDIDRYAKKLIELYISGWRYIEYVLMAVIVLSCFGFVEQKQTTQDATELLSKYYTEQELASYTNREKSIILGVIREKIKEKEDAVKKLREIEFNNEAIYTLDDRLNGTYKSEM